MNKENDPQPPPLPKELAKPLPCFFRGGFLILLLASVGPLALPLVWFHPVLRKPWKVGITLITLIVTWISIMAISSMTRHLIEQYNILRSLMLWFKQGLFHDLL